MESRLPKPKIVLTNTLSAPSISTKMNGNKMTKNESDLPQTSSSGLADRLKKAKSTLNINAKVPNENKPPEKPNLVRAKTLSSITRGVTQAVKRAGVDTTHGVAKRPFIKPTAKTITTQKAGSTTSTTNKTLPSRKPQPAVAAKPSKWDLKGRLAHTSDELTSMRQKNKEVTGKYNELQELVNSLKESESTYKTKAKEFEISNRDLDAELKTLKTEVNKVHEEREDLNKRLKETEESYKNTSNMLDEFKKKCATQEVLLKGHESQVQCLTTDLETQKKLTAEVTAIKEELESLVYRMDMDRRVLHNAIQELKGNIRVFCRVRPKTPNESEKRLCTINFVDECTIEVAKSDGSDAVSCSGKYRGTRQEFSFDKVFPPHTTQADIFEELSLLVQSALEGYNVCVFAYGQTGSGKTYTMEGMPGLETEGMIPRTVRHIFHEMKQFELLGWEYRIEASFLEIYNEHIVDLLDSQPKTHEIRMADSKGNDLYVSNLMIEEIHSPEELHECLLTAQRNRAVAATQSNERSSRSHSVAKIRLIGTHSAKGEVSIGNLNLVDLAGSERLKNEESVRMAETKNINKSLANLGNVILALLKKQEHVPYRNSKLTHLLMPSLGGNSKTLMLLNISPLDECYNETLNSLRFASNVNNCKMSNIKRTRTVLQNAT